MKDRRGVMGLIGALFLLMAVASPGRCESAKDPIEELLTKVRPRPEEERWRLIPWQRSLKNGFEAAKKSNQPLFFFGYDGILDTGNC